MIVTTLLGVGPNTTWTGHVQHNTGRSHLCGLPDKPLLNIMRRLDPTSLQCLRRTSRVFLRLSSSPQFRRYQTVNCSEYNLPWKSFTFRRKDSELLRLLHEDSANSRCVECRKRVEQWSWHAYQSVQSLMKEKHCLACKTTHPLAYFSRAQRRHSAHSRPQQCIGHEGFVRLCQHEVVRWDSVVKAARELEKADSEQVARILLVECQHPSHLPSHRNPRAPELHHLDKIHPSVFIEGSSTSVIRLCMEWTGHLRLPDRHALVGAKRFTPTEMTHELHQFRKGTAEFIAPQSAPGSLPEMRCFDPNRCRCLRYVGSVNIPQHNWQLAHPTYDNANQPLTCRTDENCRLGPLLPPSARALRGNDNKGKTGSHTAHTVLSYPSEPAYGIRIDVDPCAGGGRCLEITYRRTILVSASGGAPCYAITPSWIEAIDLDSYGHETGEDGRRSWDGLACREDPSCPNYVRYLERPVVRACGLRRSPVQAEGWTANTASHPANPARPASTANRGRTALERQARRPRPAGERKKTKKEEDDILAFAFLILLLAYLIYYKMF
ncbi:hypothetical protein B0T24DRAFT_667687 [Lasiosphaeria ovina]|uniref:F-box domain-containing protein n=1 Tax=Lasiosphaeria ovina TaxID=92902 RepID=A0AAE0N4X6_9PEZI|nr:hypothetical protein B0T24DRAFT_667687 [Lasiosphaeria ovina]